MTRRQQNIVNKRQGNMVPDLNFLATTSPGYPKAAKTQKDDLKFNLIAIIEAFKEEINEWFKEIQKSKI